MGILYLFLFLICILSFILGDVISAFEFIGITAALTFVITIIVVFIKKDMKSPED